MSKEDQIKRLYRRAFAEYQAVALWNLKEREDPTADSALVVARALRKEGDISARRLAAQIEELCR